MHMHIGRGGTRNKSAPRTQQVILCQASSIQIPTSDNMRPVEIDAIEITQSSLENLSVGTKLPLRFAQYIEWATKQANSPIQIRIIVEDCADSA